MRRRLLRLAPGSLALILCREGGGEGPGGAPLCGQQVLAGFKAENVSSVWDPGLVRSVSALLFLGWLGPDPGPGPDPGLGSGLGPGSGPESGLERGHCALLVRGCSSHLEQLRQAWSRRALRPPRGFLITAIGDVLPVAMQPVAQSHFVPLAEVLCSVIHEMNSTQVPVNQEALLQYLVKRYPGIAPPSQEMLHQTLGSLIQERKIYHTGEGYFIVTESTYYSTGTARYRGTGGRCGESTEQVVWAHCRSCRCNRKPGTEKHEPGIESREPGTEGCEPGTERQNKGSRPTGEVRPKDEARPAALGQAASPPDKAPKEKSPKRFSLSLFRRNPKKERPKREYASFSAQFPPEQWPVRDEDSPDKLPWEIELQLIRRINPELTVDNLRRHALLLGKAAIGQAQALTSRGTSTKAPLPQHRPRGTKGPRVRGQRALSEIWAKPGTEPADPTKPEAGGRERPPSQKPRHRPHKRVSNPSPGGVETEARDRRRRLVQRSKSLNSSRTRIHVARLDPGPHPSEGQASEPQMLASNRPPDWPGLGLENGSHPRPEDNTEAPSNNLNQEPAVLGPEHGEGEQLPVTEEGSESYSEDQALARAELGPGEEDGEEETCSSLCLVDEPEMSPIPMSGPNLSSLVPPDWRWAGLGAGCVPVPGAPGGLVDWLEGAGQAEQRAHSSASPRLCDQPEETETVYGGWEGETEDYCRPGPGPPNQREERTALENHSVTGDSGIDSPRTRVSLASNNSIIMDCLKRRGLLLSCELSPSRGNGAFTQQTLLQLTPVMNV